jgi:hypothetical protein
MARAIENNIRPLLYLLVISLIALPLYDRLKVQAQSDDQVAATAAEMMASTWAQVRQNSSINALSSRTDPGCAGCNGSTGDRAVFAASWAWNPTTHQGYFIGQDHGETPNNRLRFIRFDEISNNWTVVCGDSNDCGIGSAHGYMHIGVDPATNIVYFKGYGAGGVTLSIFKFAPKDTVFALAYQDMATSNYADDCDWYPGPINDTLSGKRVRGKESEASGSFACHDGYTNGFFAWNPKTNTKYTYHGYFDGHDLAPGASGNSTIHSEGRYVAQCNCYIFGGGNIDLHKIWRLNADLTSTRLADTPIPLAIDHGANLAIDPVLGDLILVGQTDNMSRTNLVYKMPFESYVNGTGTWLQLTGANVPPFMNTSDGTTHGFPNIQNGFSAISTAIPELGVIAYVTGASHHHEMWLYKASSDLNQKTKPRDLRVPKKAP